MTRILKTLLALALLLQLQSCDKDDPISQSQMKSADVTFTYTMSPDAFNYFDYILRYTDDDGYADYITLHRAETELLLHADALPFERFFKFEVTRKDTPAPSETISWDQTCDMKIVRHYLDEHTDTITASSTVTYTATPDNFEQWATNQYIPMMAQGYELYINYAGNVNTSFD